MKSVDIVQSIHEACHRIPPLFPLSDFVAVNPFLGLSDRPFSKAAQLLRKTAKADILMPSSWYLEQLHLNRFTEVDLQETKQIEDPISFDRNALINTLQEETTWKGIKTIAEMSSQKETSDFVLEEISKWCSVYYDEGQSSWKFPWREESLFIAWKSAAVLDANPEVFGIPHFRKKVRELENSPVEIIESILQTIGIPECELPDFLHRQLMSISGWSSYVQYQSREKGLQKTEQDPLRDLLAIRLVYERFIWDSLSSLEKENYRSHLSSLTHSELDHSWWARYISHRALESSYRKKLLEQITSLNVKLDSEKQSFAQAIFCIDVRSERFRRHLESSDSGIQTFGFAGFFGMTIARVPFGETSSIAQCPVLLKPAFQIKEGYAKNEEKKLAAYQFKKRVYYAWNGFKTAAGACFPFVESIGWTKGFDLTRKTLSARKGKPIPCDCNESKPIIDFESTYGTGIPFDKQVELALGALRNLGLLQNFSRLVLICGHGSKTENNPYASGLDCGACGGHAGTSNACVAAQILNNKQVRSELQKQGVHIPEQTWFVAGLHQTTSDDVQILNTDSIPSSHQADLERLKKALEESGMKTRQERSLTLGITNAKSVCTDDFVRNRTSDWSQVRPEWGLANNAAFIAAPRNRTKGLHLDGRTFLHDYDSHLDPELKVLELILAAPVVVASWINLQYFASTVNPERYGSGNKTIHNVVGTIGIWQGNGGDLQSGLPLQSLHDGDKWIHEPLRLSVVVQAKRESVDQILERQTHVRHLFENDWISMTVIEGNEIWQRALNGTWKKPNL